MPTPLSLAKWVLLCNKSELINVTHSTILNQNQTHAFHYCEFMQGLTMTLIHRLIALFVIAFGACIVLNGPDILIYLVAQAAISGTFIFMCLKKEREITARQNQTESGTE